MNFRLSVIILSALILSSCERNGKNEWEDLDYSKVYRENARRDNDPAYTAPPSVIGCVDDDLYNCKTK